MGGGDGLKVLFGTIKCSMSCAPSLAHPFYPALSRFYLSDTTIGVGIVGPGLIGATLIQQLKDQV